jgi:hypothetical protein
MSTFTVLVMKENLTAMIQLPVYRSQVARRARVISLTSALIAVAALTGGGCGGSVGQEYRPTAPLSRWDDSEWATVLKNVATPDGYVKYDVLKQNTGGTRDALFRYVGKLGAVSPDNRPELFPTADDKLAYWINAYNAVCLYRVVERGYPGNMAASMPPFAIYLTDSTKIGGDSFSLDALERGRVRSVGDPRVHFALNCSSHSCPPLRAEPYSGAKLQAQLDDQGRRYLSDSRAVRDFGGGKVGLNDIFTTYYSGDFKDAYKRRTGKDGNLIESVKVFAGPDSPLQRATDVTGIGYDWGINEAR